MADQSSGRNAFNAGSDSAKHHIGTAHEQHARTPAPPASTPTRAVGESVVKDLPQSSKPATISRK